MRTLPRLPYQVEQKSNQNIQLMGINLTDNYVMGELEDSYHMTADRYPYMAMKPHLNHVVTPADNFEIVDIVHFNRLYIIKSDGYMYVDLSDVPSGSRPSGTYAGTWYRIGSVGTDNQFAAIHNRIIIWPAKKILTIDESAHTYTLSNMSTAHGLPEFEYICSAQNRLWGVADNEIFCSKQGEPDVFDGDMGYASSPFAAAVASEGKFTGCISFGTAVMFFKEDRVYKLLGETALNYEYIEYIIDGVKDGCYKSLCVINDTLYFMSRKGVMRYNGSYNSQIGLGLGDYDYTEAVGGYDGFHYIISMKKGTTPITFMLDLRKGIWLKDEEVYCKRFGYFGSHFYKLEVNAHSGTAYLFTDDGSQAELNKTEFKDWSMTFKPFYETTTGKYNSTSVIFGYKKHGKLIVRAEMGASSTMKIEHKLDDNRWEEVARVTKKPGVRVIALPITRDDKYQLRLSGNGDCAILGIIREFKQGSER